ncbi:MAG: hypothetical protein FJX23_08265 [Alphaproteobacteria bacterium]|nr:hypothetical protein [Alphaproteobacteria bacterium]
MRIRAELHIGNHPDRREGFVGSAFHNGKPHAIGLVKIPLEYIHLHPRLYAIFHALPIAAQRFVMAQGELALSHDFTFDAEYRQGAGLILEGLSLDVARLKASETEQVAHWLHSRYRAPLELEDDHRLSQLCKAYEAELIADMTFAGLSRQYLLALVREESGAVPHHRRVTKLIRPARAAALLASLKQRGIALDERALLAFHKEVTPMRDAWPTFRGDNFGEVSDTEGAVIFFKGFRTAGSSCIKSGPYAYAAAWAEGIRYDANGIARDAEGKIVQPEAIIPEEEYICLPSGVLTMEYADEAALALLNRFFDTPHAIYDGFDLNCAGVSGRAVFGDAYDAIPERGVKNDLLWEKEHLYLLEERGLLPEGMEYHAVDTLSLPRHLDHNCLHAATRQVAARLRTAHLRATLASIRSRQKAKVHPELYLDYPRHRLAPAQLPLGNERRAARKGAYPCVALFPPSYAMSMHGPPCVGVPPPASLAA